MGDQIKTAIERILGVPVLTRARQDLSELRTEAQRQEARTATKDQKTQQLQAQLQRLLHDQQERKKILEDKRKEKEALDSKKAANDAEIRKYERVHALLDERDTLEADIAGIEKKTKDKHEKLKEALNDAWKSLLLAKIAATRARLQTEYDTLNSAFIGRTVASQAIQQIETSLAEGSCTTCARPLDSTARTHLEYQLQRIRQAEHPEDNVERRAHLQRSLDSLQALGVTDKRALIADIYDDLDDLRIDKATKTDRINEINDAARSVKETDVRRLWNEQQSLLGELVIVEQAIQAELDAQKTNAEDIRRVETALDKSGDIDLAKERRQREICTQLHDLFDGAVSLYREELRARVEAAATEIFKGLTSDPDYTALRINENYGLYIVHRTGQVVKVRSAGNEHIVALSLMGALQKNAPLKGPIVMDSPFGRLDSTHKTNVVRNLPDMADQVILLVYESEIEPRIARNLLRGKLQREFDMHRVSSFHTRIDEKLGD